MTAPSASALEDLRAAMATLPLADADTDASTDAERFEVVHEALAAVLADVDRT